MPFEEKQNLLEIFAPKERLKRIASILEAEVERRQLKNYDRAKRRQAETRQASTRPQPTEGAEVLPPRN